MINKINIFDSFKPLSISPDVNHNNLRNHSQHQHITVQNYSVDNKEKYEKIIKEVVIPSAVALGLAAIYIYKTSKTPKKSVQSVLKTNEWDIPYKKSLLNALDGQISVNKNDTSILQSIMGKEELQNMLKTFNGQETVFSQGQRLEKWAQDTNLMTNIENFNYRANLHIHTTYSDGKMSVQNLLNSAAEYADKIAETENKQFPNMPFTIAICDHDTINGCREAVEIIAQNPEKYKNLRVVLGCELSTFHKDISEITPQHRTHLLVYNVNPFDGALTELLTKKQQRTFDAAQNIIDAMNEKMHNYWDFKEINYNLDEAKKSSWCIRDGLNTVNSPLKDYFQFRKIYQETMIYNKPLDDFLKEHNFSVTFEESCRNVTYVHKKLTNTEDMPYWKKYLISLKWEILKKLHGDDFELKQENYKQNLEEINKYFVTPEKNLDAAMQNIEKEFYTLIKPDEIQITDFTEALQQLSKDKNISLGIAHPAFICPYHFQNQDITKKEDFIKNLFKNFKEYGKENALYFEKIYPYFNNGSYTKINDEFLKFINNEAEKNRLIPSGSLDNHGKNLFLTE